MRKHVKEKFERVSLPFFSHFFFSFISFIHFASLKFLFFSFIFEMRFLIFSLFIFYFFFFSVSAQPTRVINELAPSVIRDPFAANVEMTKVATLQLNGYKKKMEEERQAKEAENIAARAKKAAERAARRSDQASFMNSLNDNAKYRNGINLKNFDEEIELDSAMNENYISSPLKQFRNRKLNKIQVNVKIN